MISVKRIIKSVFNMKVGLYALSMLPMYIIVSILSWKIPVCWPWENWKFIGFMECISNEGILIPIVCIILIAISIVFGLYLKCLLSGSQMGVVEVKDVKNVGWDMMAFVSSFFFPIVSFNLPDKNTHAIVLLLLYLMIGRIFILSDMYYTNPTLLLLGFYILDVKSIEKDQGKTKSHNVILICWTQLKLNDKYTYIKLDDNIYFAKKYNDE